MTSAGRALGIFSALLVAVPGCWNPAHAQVSPAEIANPRLKTAEQTYFRQLVAMNRAIAKIQFPFPFVLTRAAGLDPSEQASADTRGLEFVTFKERTILKISGNYNAAFSAQMLTQNERAGKILEDVIVPVLGVVPSYFSAQDDFDGLGFEISYHVRTRRASYDYEGSEVLTVVFEKAEALAYLSAQDDTRRQAILDESEIYVNGEKFGLALGMRDAFDADRLAKPGWPARATKRQGSALQATSGKASPDGLTASSEKLEADPKAVVHHPLGEVKAAESGGAGEPMGAAPSQADAEALQAKYQAQLDRLAQEGVALYHFVEYAPPSLVVFHNRIYLEVTMRNPALFDRSATSIYKRAAQSFDLFLAPLFSSLLKKVPEEARIAGLDVTVLNGFTSKSAPASEAIEFICPLASLREFTQADITSQELIDQSLVLVNGVRIALNLQQVE